MIRLVRPAQPPTYAKRAARAFARLEAVADAGGYKAQRRFEFNSEVWISAKDALGEATHGKCAYCESRVGATTPGDVEHFRPKQRAEGMTKGEVHPDHYWWLAYSWPNLLFSCPACHRAKRNRFPVRGRRAERSDELSVEEPLLLDPFGDIEPTDHISFEDDGTVRPLSDLGDVTIEVLTLNRTALVGARRALAVSVQQQLHARPSVGRELQDELEDPTAEYAALRRQLLERHQADRRGEAPERKQAVRPAGSGGLKSAPQDLGAVWIEEIELVNFGCIRDLQLSFGQPATGREPWILLLGANGAGKSTILKAIALALTTPANRQRLAPDASRYLNRSSGSTRGSVRIRFNRGDEVGLEFRRGSRRFEAEGRRPDFALAGYGSTRLLAPRAGTRAERATGPRLINLFDPWAALAHAEPWLADPRQVRPDDFKLLAGCLKTLLSVEDDIEVSRRSGALRAELYDGRYDLDELSAGYQSILAFALDLTLAFAGELAQGFSMENFEGMVLIDELEVHLHPEWKRRVVADLRSMFPHLQFVATTHDPLCLRGLEPGEIHLLRRTGVGVSVEQIDVPPGLDADEILTGSWFGLETTLDEKVEQDLLEYRQLRMTGADPGSPQVAALQRSLEATLGTYTGTSIGRVMVDAASELVAHEPQEKRKALSQEAVKQRLLARAKGTSR